jgi:hypothetical protein
MAVCREVVPPLEEIAPGHRSACWLNHEAGARGAAINGALS